MNFKFNVSVIEPQTKGYAPTKLEIWLAPATDGVVKMQTKTTENLEGENGNGAGVRTEERDYAFPDEMIQPAITGYDVASGQPTVSNEAINQLLAQFNLVIVA